MRLRTDSQSTHVWLSGEVSTEVDRINAATGIPKRIIMEAALRSGLSLELDPVERVAIDAVATRPVRP